MRALANAGNERKQVPNTSWLCSMAYDAPDQRKCHEAKSCGGTIRAHALLLSLSLGVGEYNISVICNCDNIVILNKFYVLTAEKW